MEFGVWGLAKLEVGHEKQFQPTERSQLKARVWQPAGPWPRHASAAEIQTGPGQERAGETERGREVIGEVEGERERERERESEGKKQKKRETDRERERDREGGRQTPREVERGRDREPSRSSARVQSFRELPGPGLHMLPCLVRYRSAQPAVWLKP